MWDTTTERMPDDEIMFIFGHESGHYVLNHIPKMLTGLAVALFFVFWGCAAFCGVAGAAVRRAVGIGCRGSAGEPGGISDAAVRDFDGEFCAGRRCRNAIQPAL